MGVVLINMLIYKLLSKIFSVQIIQKHYYMKSTKVQNLWRILQKKPMRVRGNWPHPALCIAAHVVLSVLTPTRANSISRHRFG